MSQAPQPIRSQREHDTEVEEALEAFILGLGGHLDDLQEAVLAQDWAQLTKLALDLSRAADELGYPSLQETLMQTVGAAGRANGEEARKSVADLTELVQRVRRGHHSAA